jgi:hypothetical protein
MQFLFTLILINFIFRPLKADEFLPVPSHRATATNKSETSLKNSESSKKEEKQKSSSKKEKTKSKDESKSSNKKEKKKDSSKEKKSSKKTKENNNTVDLLISTDLQINRNENDYNELISPDQESTTTLNGNHEKEANANEKTVCF